ncbi:ATP-grasp domain-containing protein [Trebonia kvetii]|uniref:Biotin-dependent 3-methylcrotonyl-coenzyme A carboxylase alpha1 subunit n=1 Tax=Trebonia kvetii TaxID=2480626 RepID=A0A6P2C3Q4_9ACTN|nr:biotin carboxylase N-terminal domain-containing protein [Trebonia kvetii]TVZ05577.1 ATP-grasp domain-containing protein [Trebonia kvetii]
MFSKVLIANRGEIAVRVIRTLRILGIASVAVYSDADAGARHVLEADEAVRIGPAAALESYLNVGALIAAARDTGAEAVHPGYGFLAENAGFARACAEAGLVFIGPSAEAIDAMGDKIAAKATVAAAGVPVVPGSGRPGMSDDELIGSLNDSWFPVLIKPSAGGGGKGMRVVPTPAELPAALTAARRTAVAAFGDGTLLVERYLPRPRHIEIQVLADAHGHVVHLGERECSLQRRHQKIIEEAPSPLLSPAQRAAMGASAVAAARSVGYVGAGTVEFIVAGDAPEDFFFMEMNTRLQVEHPVTELVYGLDLVEWQLRVAAGEPLPFGPHPESADGDGGAALPMRGHAVEARVYAEDPVRGFLPTGGTVLALREPAGPGIRVDSALAEGVTVTSDYDPMLGKVIAWGEDRATALRRLDAALSGTVVLGVTTNVAFLRGLLADPDVQAGRLDTGLVERVSVPGGAGSAGRGSGAGSARAGNGPGSAGEASAADDAAAGTGIAEGDPAAGATTHALAAAALARLLIREPRGPVTDPWDIPDGWRPGDRAWTRLRLSHAAGTADEVRVRGLASAGAEVAVGDGEPEGARAEFRAAPGGGTDLVITAAGRTRKYAYAADGATTWLGRDGRTWAVREEQAASPRAGRVAAADGSVRSPMPGTVLAVHVSAGERVTAGQPVLVVEAMKMEHTVTAPVDGVIAELTAKPGQQVTMDETLAVIGPESADIGRLGTPGCT